MRFSPIPTLMCVVFLVWATILSVAGDTCTKVTSCKCQYENGDTIDLTPLAKTGDTAKFADVPDKAGLDDFSWNPCNPFTEGTCKDVAVCQVQNEFPPSYFILGTQASAKFMTDDQDRLSIEYSAVTGTGLGTLRTAYVVLTCGTGGDTLSVDGERIAPAIYDLELNSPHACRIPGSSGGSSGLSAGSIMVIIFFVAISVFFMVGVPVQIFLRKQSGRRVIPMSDYLFAIPGYIKDGTLFVIKRGKHTPKYDSI